MRAPRLTACLTGGLRRGAACIVASGWLVALAWPEPAHSAGLKLEGFGGHLSTGYSKLFTDDGPGGSFALAGGIDYRLQPDLRAGITVGYALLGSRTVERGSLIANVDYSLFEAVAFAHWEPRGLWPLGRISLGPGLFAPRAELSTAGGGASFSDLARDGTAPGMALDATLMTQRAMPVRIGLEVGGRIAFLEQKNWVLAGVRLAFHY